MPSASHAIEDLESEQVAFREKSTRTHAKVETLINDSISTTDAALELLSKLIQAELAATEHLLE